MQNLYLKTLIQDERGISKTRIIEEQIPDSSFCCQLSLALGFSDSVCCRIIYHSENYHLASLRFCKCKRMNYIRRPVFVLYVSGARIHNGIPKGLFARPGDNVYRMVDLNVTWLLCAACRYNSSRQQRTPSFAEHFRTTHPFTITPVIILKTRAIKARFEIANVFN